MTSQAPSSVNPPSDPDAAKLVDAAVAAGHRSRGIVYLILILTLLTFVSIKNNYEPDWVGSRANLYRHLYNCLKAPDIAHIDCSDFKKWAGDKGHTADSRLLDGKGNVDPQKVANTLGFVLGGNFDQPGSNFYQINKAEIEELKARYELFLKKEIDAYTIAVPFLGLNIDTNDLWLISGLVMLVLMQLLYGSLRQECQNIDEIKQLDPRFIRILRAHQFLSVVRSSNWLGSLLYIVLGLLPTGLFLYIATRAYPSAGIYIGRTYDKFQFAVEIVVLILVACSTAQCFWIQRRLGKLLK